MEGSSRGSMTVTVTVASTSTSTTAAGLATQGSPSLTKMEADSSPTTTEAARASVFSEGEDLPGLSKSLTDDSVSDESNGASGDEDRPDLAKDSNGGSAGEGGATASDSTGARPDYVSSPGGAEVAEEGATKRESLRETLRARLRAQEARLKGLVRNASADGVESVIGQMKTVQEKMQQVAAEKTELEKELERLRGATGDDDFLKEKLAGIQDGFDKQVRTIQSLQRSLDARDADNEILRNQLLAKLRAVVQLEYDLSCHELHYTNYAAEQYQLGEDALNEIKTTQGGAGNDSLHESQSSLGGGSNKNGTARKAQKLISKLLYDLDSLEAKYKEERIDSITKIEALHAENDELRSQVEVLKLKLGEASDSLSESSDDVKDSFEAATVSQLRKHLEIAEARKNLFRKEVNHLRNELQEAKMGAEADESRAKLEIDSLRDENVVLRSRIAKLDAKKEGGGLLKKKKKDDASAASKGPEHMMELKIRENYRERCRLENAVEIKDKQISTLKREVANLRLKDISEGNVNDSMYTEFDATLLRTAPNGSRSAAFRPSAVRPGEDGDGGGDDSAYVVELQRQLQEAQHQLVKKDQELVIERAKAASTAAGLLARITELTGKKVDGKSQKQVPLRFYL